MSKIKILSGVGVVVLLVVVGVYFARFIQGEDFSSEDSANGAIQSEGGAGAVVDPSGNPLPRTRVRENIEITDNDRKIIDSIRDAYVDFLKTEELSRVEKVTSYEAPELTDSYSYEIRIKSPTVDDLSRWSEFKSEMADSADARLRRSIIKSLSDEQKDYELRDSSERKVTFRVPHDTEKPVIYSEYFILDLESGRDSTYPAAADLPHGVVHNLLKRANVSASINGSWRYDRILQLNVQDESDVE